MRGFALKYRTELIAIGAAIALLVIAPWLGGVFLLLSLMVMAVALTGLIRGTIRWARIPNRTAATSVLVVAFVVLLTSTSAIARTTPSTNVSQAQPTASIAAQPKSTPSPTATVSDAEPVDVAVVSASAASVAIADSSLTQGTALDVLNSLPVQAAVTSPSYQRANFGTAWADVDANGCDTRDDILARDLVNVVKSGTCVVSSGTLTSAYTGATTTFTRGQTTSSKVQIDHVVALKDAWETGAANLTAAQRLSLANDPINLQAVEGPVNASKGASDAAQWLPSNSSYRCEYVARQISVKKTYGLWVTPAEKQAMINVLGTCSSQAVVSSTFTPVYVAPVQQQPVKQSTTNNQQTTQQQPVQQQTNQDANVTYANCDAVRAAGKAPLHVGDPGYAKKLDRDGDGIACE